MPSQGKIPLFLEYFEEFLPDIVKGLWNTLRGTKKKEGDGEGTRTSPATAELKQKRKETLQAVAAYWALVPEESLKNLNAVRVGSVMSLEQQDASEDALGELLMQLTNGIFPARLEKFIEYVPKTSKDAEGKPSTTFGEKVTEKYIVDPKWDPGQIFIDALTKAGKTQESAAQFWKMLIQASPTGRFWKKLSEWTARQKGFSRFLCWITFTKREWEEGDEEMIARAWKQLRTFIFSVAFLSVFAAVFVIPVLFWNLVFGAVAATTGVADPLKSVFRIMFFLAALSPIVVAFLRLWGIAPTWRKYWAVLFFLTTVGLGVRLLAHFFNLGDHALAGGAAIISIAVLAWSGVYRRIADPETFASRTKTTAEDGTVIEVTDSGSIQGRSSLGTVVSVAALLLIGSVALMSRTYLLAAEKQLQQVGVHLNSRANASPITGEVKWCRPNLDGVDGYSWPFELPDGTPRRFRCSDAVDGNDPFTLFPSKEMSAEDILDYRTWEQEPTLSKVIAEAEEIPPTSLPVAMPETFSRAHEIPLHLLPYQSHEFDPMTEAGSRNWSMTSTDPKGGCVDIYYDDQHIVEDCPGTKDRRMPGEIVEAETITFTARDKPVFIFVRFWARR